MSYHFDRLRVLIVDDNPHMRSLLTAIVQALGVKTLYEADSAETAWKSFTRNGCDFIFLDWEMKGMSGLEFTKQVRMAPDSPNRFVPIVMLTGYTSVERVRTARDAGVTEFLAKPVSSNTILSRMTSVIENPRSFVRTKSYFGPDRRRRRVEDYQGPERRIGESGFETIDNPGKPDLCSV